MRKPLTILFTAIFSILVFAQKSEQVLQLEDAITSPIRGVGQYQTKRRQAYSLLAIDKYNMLAIEVIVRSFPSKNKQDSVAVFFDNLIDKNKTESEPYLIRELFSHIEERNYAARIQNLQQAFKIDSVNITVNYLLGKLYYKLFISENNNGKNRETADYYANNAIRHFENVCKRKETQCEVLKYPIIQLANYLNDMQKVKYYESYNSLPAYFPFREYNIALESHRETNYTSSVLYNLLSDETPLNEYVRANNSGVRLLYSYSLFLLAMDEPVLNNSLPSNTFRFLYLRTFHNPLMVRLENKNDSITVFWKVCDGMGGYSPGKMIENKFKKLTLDDWNSFTTEIEKSKFWDMPIQQNEIMGLDGSQWILEGKKSEKYHAVDRWCGISIAELCKKLIDFTDLEFNNENKMY
jgi:hypothetical protein